ncbi:hypothetical protein [Poseidonibacter ostreae]|nr:hypothetical protein [Poseidonibacter ostreae]
MADGKRKINEHGENCGHTKIKYGDYYDYNNLYLECKVPKLK